MPWSGSVGTWPERSPAEGHEVLKRVLTLLAGALVLGFIVAASTGETRRASVEVWIAVVAGWLVWMMLADLMKLAPPHPERLHGVLGRRRPPKVDDVNRPRSLAALEGLLLNARDSERAMTLRLQPRLAALTEHFLLTRHGIDVRSEPERARALLGDLSLLGGLEVKDGDEGGMGVAGVEDIDRLLDVVLHDGGGVGASGGRS